MNHRAALLSLAASALAAVPAAGAVGPGLPAVEGALTSQDVTYVTALHGSSTVLTKRLHGKAVARVAISGGWGLPLVTLGRAERGGLSPNGRVLVLGDDVRPDGTLRMRSSFAVVDTRSPALVRTINLRGDFSFDALSPQGRWLYLIHHVASADNRYQVQAYDLRAGVLLPGVIADKRQAGWLMAGMPVSRATSPGGRWVYTLYEQSDNYPFVHALDTVNRTAVCVGLPWQWADPSSGIGVAKLELHGRTLAISGGKTRFALDTATFRVSKG